MSTTAPQMKSQAQPSGTYQPKGMLIDGKWVGAASGQRITIENPGKRTAVAEVPRAAAADVEAAVAAADKAFPAWKNVVPRERGKMLLKIAEAMEARSEEMARTIALETGNALRTQARGEAKLAADGVSEVLDTWLPAGRRMHAGQWRGVVQLNATDAAQEWYLRLRGEGVALLDTRRSSTTTTTARGRRWPARRAICCWR